MYPADNTVTESDGLAHYLLRLPQLKMTRLSVAPGHFQVTSLWLCFLAMIVGEEYAVTEALGCFFHLCPRGWFLFKPNRFQCFLFVMKVRNYGFRRFSMPLFIVFLHFSSFCLILFVLLHVLNYDHLNKCIWIKMKRIQLWLPHTVLFLLNLYLYCLWYLCTLPFKILGFLFFW